MDTFEVLNNLLVKLFNDILDVEEKAIITDEFKDISVTDITNFSSDSSIILAYFSG